MLHCAARHQYGVVMQLVLNTRVDVKAKSRYGKPALHCAAEVGLEVVMRLLLDRGADVNANDVSDGTALISASVWGTRQ